MRLATLIIIAPSAILIFIAGADFAEDLYGYGRFIAPGPGEWPSFHRICKVNADGASDGPLGVARPDYQGATVQCICSPMSCLASSTIEEVYQLRFARDAMLAATASMFVAVFASQRQYLKKRGVFDKKPLSILAASALVVSLAVLSLFNPGIIILSAAPLGLTDSSSLVYQLLTFRYYALVLMIASLAVGTAIVYVGKERTWMWKASIAFLGMYIAVILLYANYTWLTRPDWHYLKYVMLTAMLVAMYLLFRRESREYFGHNVSRPKIISA